MTICTLDQMKSRETSTSTTQNRCGGRPVTYNIWNWLQHVKPHAVCLETFHYATLGNVSCQVCNAKSHAHCGARVSAVCKWTTLTSVGDDVIKDANTRTVRMPHQWSQGIRLTHSNCVVCGHTCRSVGRLQDYYCLWCHSAVHGGCRESIPVECSLGPYRISILPPTSIIGIDSDGFWRATQPHGSSPLLVFVNSKSGDRQGRNMVRRFRQLLNPAQVFDLIEDGSKMGLRLFQNFELFRVLVCGGDGSVSWVLNEIDRLSLQKQCQVGVLPLGTGNDLAQILGWSSSFDDDARLPDVLEQLERAQIRMLDRWSVFVREDPAAGEKLSSASVRYSTYKPNFTWPATSRHDTHDMPCV